MPSTSPDSCKSTRNPRESGDSPGKAVRWEVHRGQMVVVVRHPYACGADVLLVVPVQTMQKVLMAALDDDAAEDGNRACRCKGK
jgi:hypothetical protein